MGQMQKNPSLHHLHESTNVLEKYGETQDPLNLIQQFNHQTKQCQFIVDIPKAA